MKENKHLTEITNSILASLPPSLKDILQELRDLFHEKLEAQLKKLDLVTREEFAVQQKVLARTREKLEGLEKQVAAWEANKERK